MFFGEPKPAFANIFRALRPGGRLVAVTLYRPDPPPLTVRLYTALHRRWPKQLDCRPIQTATLLTVAGFLPGQEQTTSVGGLPVAIVLVAFQRQIIRGLTAGAVK